MYVSRDAGTDVDIVIVTYISRDAGSDVATTQDLCLHWRQASEGSEDCGLHSHHCSGTLPATLTMVHSSGAVYNSAKI